MNMNLDMFLVFPGILVTIGVVLLLISIVLIIIAYRTAGKATFIIDEENNNIAVSNDVPNLKIDIPPVVQPEINTSIPEIKKEEQNLEETKIFKLDELKKLGEDEKVQEFIKLKPTVPEEKQEKEEVLETLGNGFESKIEEKPKIVLEKEVTKIEEPQEEEEEIELL